MKKPKLVYWDLETLPQPRQVYDRLPSIGAWPGRTLKAELQTIMCFAYKIEGMKKAEVINVWDTSDDIHDDSALISMAYDILIDADEIVTHNGKSFDMKHLNTGLLRWGMPPLPKINHLDTKILAKRGLGLYSNSLDAVSNFFEVGQKIHWANKWSTWTKFAFGEDTKKDRDLMAKYAKMDVEVLQQVYKKLRPFATEAVNRNHFTDGKNCPTCGSKNIHRNGVRRSKTKTYQRYLCGDCGSTSRTDAKDKNPRSY